LQDKLDSQTRATLTGMDFFAVLPFFVLFIDKNCGWW